MDEADARADKRRADALAALWLDYDQAYEIEITGDGEWRWRRLDRLGGWTVANGPDELRQQVRDDFDLKPVLPLSPPRERLDRLSFPRLSP